MNVYQIPIHLAVWSPHQVKGRARIPAKVRGPAHPLYRANSQCSQLTGRAKTALSVIARPVSFYKAEK